jgi:hypothetical protein
LGLLKNPCTLGERFEDSREKNERNTVLVGGTITNVTSFLNAIAKAVSLNHES